MSHEGGSLTLFIPPDGLIGLLETRQLILRQLSCEVDRWVSTARVSASWIRPRQIPPLLPRRYSHGLHGAINIVTDNGCTRTSARRASHSYLRHCYRSGIAALPSLQWGCSQLPWNGILESIFSVPTKTGFPLAPSSEQGYCCDATFLEGYGFCDGCRVRTDFVSELVPKWKVTPSRSSSRTCSLMDWLDHGFSVMATQGIPGACMGTQHAPARFHYPVTCWTAWCLLL